MNKTIHTYTKSKKPRQLLFGENYQNEDIDDNDDDDDNDNDNDDDDDGVKQTKLAAFLAGCSKSEG